MDHRLGPVQPTVAAVHNEIQGAMFAGLQHVSVTGGTYNNFIQPASMDINRKWIKKLQDHTATGAFHNSEERRDAPRCHPQTRLAVTKEIMDWATESSRSENFLWIYGPAGSGKSSIAQRIAERCEERNILASDFFFSRMVPDRNKHTQLIPSLAYQLTVSIPGTYNHIAEAIKADNIVFSRSLETQINSLILNPLAKLEVLGHEEPSLSYPHVIIIDGLDECGDPDSQHYILSSLSSAMQRVCTRLIFIIVSRPERAIRHAFNGILSSCTRRLELGDRYNPEDDIRRFLQSQFEEIKRTHPSLASKPPENWPSHSDINRLVQKASGQFIYASTVVKFVNSPVDRPTERLKVILGSISLGSSALEAVDALYKHILLSVAEAMLEKVLTVLAFILVLPQLGIHRHFPSYHQNKYETLEFMEAFFGYESGDLNLAFADLHSLVYVPPPSEIAAIRSFHDSLADFLLDKDRSDTLFIDTGIYSARFSRICIGHITPHLRTEEKTKEWRTVPDFASKALLPFLAIAQSDEILLRELSQFPIGSFLSVRFYDCKLFALLPSLFDWIQKQDPILHDKYNTYYTAYIKSVLSDCSPGWYHLLTALAMKIRSNGDETFNFLLISFGNTGLFFQHILGSHKYPENRGDYISRLVDILTEPGTEEYCVDASRYTKLAINLLEKLWDNGGRIFENNWQEMFLEFISETLGRIPGEATLKSYLSETRHKTQSIKVLDIEKRQQLLLLIDNYIQSCVAGTDARKVIVQKGGSTLKRWLMRILR